MRWLEISSAELAAVLREEPVPAVLAMLAEQGGSPEDLADAIFTVAGRLIPESVTSGGPAGKRLAGAMSPGTGESS